MGLGIAGGALDLAGKVFSPSTYITATTPKTEQTEQLGMLADAATMLPTGLAGAAYAKSARHRSNGGKKE